MQVIKVLQCDAVAVDNEGEDEDSDEDDDVETNCISVMSVQLSSAPSHCEQPYVLQPS